MGRTGHTTIAFYRESVQMRVLPARGALLGMVPVGLGRRFLDIIRFLPYFVLFYTILSYFGVFCAILPYSALVYPILPYSVVFCPILPYFTIFCAIL